MKFVCEDSFWKLFPEASIGVVVADGILPTDQVSEENAAKAAKLLDRANVLAQKWVPDNTISKNEVPAVWREAYRKFKTKKGVRSSVENLLKRVLKDNPVGHINPSVDISNAISLKYAIPMGAENVDAFEGTFRLKVTDGGDYFLPIGSDENDPTDGQRTEVSDNTPHCVFIMENIQPERLGDLQEAVDELAGQLEEILGATVTHKEVLTHEHPEMELC